MCILCLLPYVICCVVVTWWGGPGGIEAWFFGPLLPSVLWHYWLGRLTHKNAVPDKTYSVFSGTVYRYRLTLLNQSIKIVSLLTCSTCLPSILILTLWFPWREIHMIFVALVLIFIWYSFDTVLIMSGGILRYIDQPTRRQSIPMSTYLDHDTRTHLPMTLCVINSSGLCRNVQRVYPSTPERTCQCYFHGVTNWNLWLHRPTHMMVSPRVCQSQEVLTDCSQVPADLDKLVLLA